MAIDTSYYSYAASAYQTSATYKTTQANINISGSYFEVTGDANGSYYKNIEDGVSVSDTAKELLERIRDLDVFKCIFPNNDARQKTKSLNEVEGDFLSDFNDFSSAFGKMSAMMGYDASSALTMGLDGQGGMTASGEDSAMAGKFAGAFNGNSTMVARFAVMAARASLADAGYTVDGFKEAYAEDPVQAIKDNIDALKERLLGFRTTASGGKMQYGFERPYEVDIDYSSTTASYTTTATDAA